MMKYILSLFLFFLLAGTVFAQSEQDQVIFKAMQDEIGRNKDSLMLPDAPQPFFISYALGRFRQFEVVGILGGIVRSFEADENTIGGVQLMLGDYGYTSDLMYLGQYAEATLPQEVNYLGIRRGFWNATDVMYKYSLQAMAAKQTYLKANPRTPEEDTLAELQKVKPIERVVEGGEPYMIDLRQLEVMIKELSLLFKDYKEIYDTKVGVTGIDMEIYRQTTDGVSVKQPSRFVNFYAKGTVTTDEGEKISDTYALFVKCPRDLPSLEELKKNVKEFAERLIKIKDAPRVEEFYAGPVLFEEAAVSSIFVRNLVSKSGLIAHREPNVQQHGVLKTLGDRMGKKIIDSRLTVKNYSTLDKYNGVSLIGAYEVDAEGVVPEKEMILVEHGILRGMLNGCVPTLKTPYSMGSSRYVYNNIAYRTAPGTLHVKADKGMKPEKMKKELIRAAKEEGLDYAYIVRRMGDVNALLYRVNVKDGSETMMRTADITDINLAKIKRVLEISSKENVSNYMMNGGVLTSLIYPSAMLIEDVEIGKIPLQTEKKPVLEYPLRRN